MTKQQQQQPRKEGKEQQPRKEGKEQQPRKEGKEQPYVLLVSPPQRSDNEKEVLKEKSTTSDSDNEWRGKGKWGWSMLVVMVMMICVGVMVGILESEMLGQGQTRGSGEVVVVAISSSSSLPASTSSPVVPGDMNPLPVSTQFNNVKVVATSTGIVVSSSSAATGDGAGSTSVVGSSTFITPTTTSAGSGVTTSGKTGTSLTTGGSTQSKTAMVTSTTEGGLLPSFSSSVAFATASIPPGTGALPTTVPSGAGIGSGGTSIDSTSLLLAGLTAQLTSEAPNYTLEYLTLVSSPSSALPPNSWTLLSMVSCSSHSSIPPFYEMEVIAQANIGDFGPVVKSWDVGNSGVPTILSNAGDVLVGLYGCTGTSSGGGGGGWFGGYFDTSNTTAGAVSTLTIAVFQEGGGVMSWVQRETAYPSSPGSTTSSSFGVNLVKGELSFQGGSSSGGGGSSTVVGGGTATATATGTGRASNGSSGRSRSGMGVMIILAVLLL